MGEFWIVMMENVVLPFGEWLAARPLIASGVALAAALLLMILVIMMYGKKSSSAAMRRLFVKKVEDVARQIEGIETRIGMQIKEEAFAAARCVEEVKKSLAAMQKNMDAGTDPNEILAPLTRQADAHLKQAEQHRDDLGARIIQSSEERLNRIESRLEGISELVKERARDGGKGGDLRDKLEQQSLYLHDEFANLAVKIDGFAKAGDGASPAANFADEDKQLLESLSRSVNLLGEEVNAKLSLLHDKMEAGERLWRDIPDAFPALRERVEELAKVGERSESRGEIPFAQLMQAGEIGDEDGRRRLAAMLPQILPLAYFTLNAELPGGRRADAFVRFPDPGDSVVIDAGFSPPQATDGADGGDREFARALVAHIDHIADDLISPPHTGENALLFIPSESLFAEIHARLRDALRHAQKRKVWLVSPAVLPAVLNTVNAAVRDHDARRQLRELRETAARLAEEARHFENRIADIGDHVNSAQRIIQRAENAGGRLVGGIRGMSRPPMEAPSPRIPENNDSS